ncbi:unnamed protein product [Rhizoctonia solani]|uniref:Uncharacterized protein n=1 Tax=Rhizoctonia solani TaxID=456999 RepID=A0A8H3A8S1_9AGAM|nr:unnamed protein product [Rhizoctonia solani]
MPRIRKKTSKRGTTHQRTKIRQKATETRRKRKKETTKNPQWKSKHKKDPGIPNTLPFKEDILTEIELTRRQAEQDKQRRKENKPQPRPEPESVSAPAHVAAITADEDAPPILIDSSLPNLGSVLDSAHVVLYVLDARDPQSFRNAQLEKVVREKGKPMVVVLTKTDLVPREVLAGWIASLRAQFIDVVPFRASEAFISPTKGKQQAPLESISKESLFAALSKYQTAEKDTRVAVVGLTNSGKSTLVNSLLASSALPTYTPSIQQPKRATYQTATEGAQPVQIGAYTLIDTPGFSVVQFNAQPGGGTKKLSAEQVELSKAKDLLLRNRGSFVHWKETDAAAAYIVSRAKHQDLILHYNVPAFQPGDVNAFLGGVARARGRIRKHGALDLSDTARSVVRDWSLGSLPFYAVPPTSSTSVQDPVVDACLGLKEFRAAPRAWPVQLDAGEPDERSVEVDVAYPVLGVESVRRMDKMEAEEVVEEDEGSDEEDEDEEMASEDDELEDESSEEDEEEELPPPKKPKKVLFATTPLPPASKSKSPSTRTQSKPALKPTPAPRRIGNASTGKSKKPTVVNVAGEENYDFSQFF